MIPKIIHLTSRAKPLTGFEAEMLEKARSLHGGWDLRVWDDSDNLALVKSDFPQYLDRYNALPFPIMRADLVRYMYMHSIGGWYIDTDYELIRSLEDLQDYKLILPKSREKEDFNDPAGPFKIGNAVFASEPGQQYWADVLEVFFNSKLPENFTKDRVEWTTGPEFITSVYFKAPEKYSHAHLPGRNLFHPDEFKTSTQKAIKEGYYGIHHCSGTWRDKKFVPTVKGHIKHLLGRMGL